MKNKELYITRIVEVSLVLIALVLQIFTNIKWYFIWPSAVIIYLVYVLYTVVLLLSAPFQEKYNPD